MLDKLFEASAETGTRNAKIEYLNMPTYVKSRLNKVLKKESEEVQQIYDRSQTKKYREEMEPLIRSLLKKYSFDLRFGEMIVHVEDQKLKDKN